jgi:hypothetical protein
VRSQWVMHPRMSLQTPDAADEAGARFRAARGRRWSCLRSYDSRGAAENAEVLVLRCVRVDDGWRAFARRSLIQLQLSWPAGKQATQLVLLRNVSPSFVSSVMRQLGGPLSRAMAVLVRRRPPPSRAAVAARSDPSGKRRGNLQTQFERMPDCNRCSVTVKGFVRYFMTIPL